MTILPLEIEPSAAELAKRRRRGLVVILLYLAALSYVVTKVVVGVWLS